MLDFNFFILNKAHEVFCLFFCFWVPGIAIAVLEWCFTVFLVCF